MKIKNMYLLKNTFFQKYRKKSLTYCKLLLKYAVNFEILDYKF